MKNATRQKKDITIDEVKATIGKADDILFPIEAMTGIVSTAVQAVRVEFVDDDGNWEKFGFSEFIDMINLLIETIDRLGEEAFGQDFTPEIKNASIKFVLSLLKIKYNK
jgi:hypothetical protein